MTAFREQRTTRAAGWSRRIAVFAAVLLLTDWAGHHFGLVETPAYLWALGLAALLAALALLFAGWAFARLWNFGDRGGRDIAIGLLAALIVLAPFAVASYKALTLPPLRDISTDLEAPPPLAGEGDSGPAMTPGGRRLQENAYPLVTGRRYELPFTEALAMVEKVAQRQGWKILSARQVEDADMREAVVTATASSFVLELPADVSIRVNGDEETSFIDMRSASRYGRHDLGDNSERVIGFLAQLDQEISGRSGLEQAE